MDLTRIIPIAIALIYIAVGLYALISRPSKSAVGFFFFVLVLIAVSLSMIWSEIGIGGWGGTESHGRWRYTPPSLVRLCGWGLLLFPIWMPLIVLLIQWMG